MSILELDDTAAHININEDNFIDYAKDKGFGDIHFKVDPKSGMVSIISIHSTKFGPALGGCRLKEYSSPFAALYDGMRLARGMSFKSALVGLPLGGGKAVIIKPNDQFDRQRYFEAFGEFVESLAGRYVTAVDSGTSLDDMDIVYSKTNYVASLAKENGEPSGFTAEGVFLGIKAAVQFKLNRDTLDGLHIAIQGIGKVGYDLARRLHQHGVKLTVSDINHESLMLAKKEFNADIVDPKEIHKVPCDVFAPCALGAAINDTTIKELNTKIIAGSANNQLARAHHGEVIHKKGVLFAPDYVINAGGLIHASSCYNKTPENVAHKQIENIYHSLLTIFERSQSDNLPCSLIADRIAEEKLA
jgi:leucine dehydrogenase